MTLSDAVVDRLLANLSPPELADNRYTLHAVLGEGGMGTVYLGTDELLQRDVAIKVARAAVGRSSTAFIERLRAEARVLAQLEHPGIVPVHDAGSLTDGRVFYVMKRVHGNTLAAAIASIVEIDRRLGIFERVADTLSFAHEHGVIHRDLKPGNIMVGDFGEVLVMDWGVALALGADEFASGPSAIVESGRTAAGTVLGTPGFMAPEQAAAGNVDRRADVYSLGALLAFLLTSDFPTDGSSAAALLTRHRDVPRPLRAIAERCLANEPEARYETAGEVAEEIRRYRAGGAVSAYRETWLERLGRLYRAYQVPILLLLAYLAMRIIVAFLGR